MDQSWAPVFRRPQGEVPIPQVFNEFFNALCADDAPELPPQTTIPDTIVYTGGGWSWFSYDEDQCRVVREPPAKTTTDRIERFFCTPLQILDDEPLREEKANENPESLEWNDAASNTKRAMDVVAVWISEKSDGKFTYTSVEYYSSRDVQQFLRKNPLRRCGVLQRYMRAAVPLSEAGNEELMIKCTFPRSLTRHSSTDSISYFIERWTNRTLTCTTNDGLTPWHLVLPVQSVAAHVSAASPPLQTNATATTCASGIDAVPLELQAQVSEVGASVFKALAFSVQRTASLAEASTTGDVPESFVFWCKELPSGKLSLLGLVSASLPSLRMRFSIFPEPTLPKSRVAKPTVGVLPNSSGTQPSPVKSLATPLRSSRTKEKMKRQSPSVSPIRHAQASPPHTCPNCGVVCEPEDCVEVPYRMVLRYALAQRQEAKHALEELIPPSRPASAKKGKDGRTVLLPGPKTARFAADVEAVKRLSDDAMCFHDDHKWADLPPLLKRLTVDPFDLAKRSVWLTRNAMVCEGCRRIFVEHAKDGTSARPHEEEKRISHPSRPASAHAKPPASLRSDVIDAIVTSDLQRMHKATRRSEREKYEMRLVVDACRAGDNDTAKEQAAEEQAAKLLEEFVCPVSTVTVSDVPFHVTLSNELFEAMQNITAVAPEPELGAVVSRPPRARSSNTSWMLPQPHTRVATSTPAPIDGVPPHHGRLHTRGRRRTFKRLDSHSFTFSQLSQTEKLLIVDFVGKEKHHSVLDDFKGPEVDENDD